MADNSVQVMRMVTTILKDLPMLKGQGTDLVEWEERFAGRVNMALRICEKVPVESIVELLVDAIIKSTSKDATLWAKMWLSENKAPMLQKPSHVLGFLLPR